VLEGFECCALAAAHIQHGARGEVVQYKASKALPVAAVMKLPKSVIVGILLKTGELVPIRLEKGKMIARMPIETGELLPGIVQGPLEKAGSQTG
jgi:hypothetical protein